MYDVIVTGAGPAGSAAGMLLAQQGARVLLLEKARFPRYKACAGGIDGIAMRALAEMGLDPRTSFQDAATELCVTSGGRFPAIYQFGRPFAFMTMRADFDGLLARAAVEHGAEFHDAEPVVSVRQSGSSVTVTTSRGSYEARVLVGADGVYSLVARSFGLNRNPILYVLVSAEMELSEEAQAAWQGRVQIDISVWPLGYSWVFPKRTHLSIGTGVPRISAKQLASRFDRFQRSLGLAGGRPLVRRSHMIGFHRQRTPIVLDRVLLIGDAAGCVDPNTGGGIGWALRSARLASGVILAYLREETNDLARYSEMFDQQLEPEFRAARVMRNSIILRFLLSPGRATHDKELWSHVIRLIRGEERYCEWVARSKLARLVAVTERVPL